MSNDHNFRGHIKKKRSKSWEVTTTRNYKMGSSISRNNNNEVKSKPANEIVPAEEYYTCQIHLRPKPGIIKELLCQCFNEENDRRLANTILYHGFFKFGLAMYSPPSFTDYYQPSFDYRPRNAAPQPQQSRLRYHDHDESEEDKQNDSESTISDLDDDSSSSSGDIATSDAANNLMHLHVGLEAISSDEMEGGDDYHTATIESLTEKEEEEEEEQIITTRCDCYECCELGDAQNNQRDGDGSVVVKKKWILNPNKFMNPLPDYSSYNNCNMYNRPWMDPRQKNLDPDGKILKETMKMGTALTKKFNQLVARSEKAAVKKSRGRRKKLRVFPVNTVDIRALIIKEKEARAYRKLHPEEVKVKPVKVPSLPIAKRRVTIAKNLMVNSALSAALPALRRMIRSELKSTQSLSLDKFCRTKLKTNKSKGTNSSSPRSEIITRTVSESILRSLLMDVSNNEEEEIEEDEDAEEDEVVASCVSLCDAEIATIPVQEIKVEEVQIQDNIQQSEQKKTAPVVKQVEFEDVAVTNDVDTLQNESIKSRLRKIGRSCNGTGHPHHHHLGVPTKHSSTASFHRPLLQPVSSYAHLLSKSTPLSFPPPPGFAPRMQEMPQKNLNVMSTSASSSQSQKKIGNCYEEEEVKVKGTTTPTHQHHVKLLDKSPETRQCNSNSPPPPMDEINQEGMFQNVMGIRYAEYSPPGSIWPSNTRNNSPVHSPGGGSGHRNPHGPIGPPVQNAYHIRYRHHQPPPPPPPPSPQSHQQQMMNHNHQQQQMMLFQSHLNQGGASVHHHHHNHLHHHNHQGQNQPPPPHPSWFFNEQQPPQKPPPPRCVYIPQQQQQGCPPPPGNIYPMRGGSGHPGPGPGPPLTPNRTHYWQDVMDHNARLQQQQQLQQHQHVSRHGRVCHMKSQHHYGGGHYHNQPQCPPPPPSLQQLSSPSKIKTPRGDTGADDGAAAQSIVGCSSWLDKHIPDRNT